jgi:hypothetical protein
MIKTWEVARPEMEMVDNYMKAPNFFWSPRMFSIDLASFKILQYFVRNTYGWRKDTYSVGIDQIAKDCHINRKTASRHIQKLLSDGWLEIVQEANKQKGLTRVYKLIHGYIELEA